MHNIAEIDKNFAVDTYKGNGNFINIDNPPFKIYGVRKNENGYLRAPEEVVKNISEWVRSLNTNTSSGMVRFSTNSKTLTVKAEMAKCESIFPHMAPLGTAGFTAFEGETFLASFFPTIPQSTICIEKFLPYKTNEEFHEITLYMPLYSAYNDIRIKIDNGAVIRPAKPFKNEKPVVFYGSSITQGACASTPSGSYINIISRKLDLYCESLGYSGSARGEDSMVEYIANLDMAAFVLDYDHNSPDDEHLLKTHKNFFDRVRAKHPDLPIIIASAIPCKVWLGDANERRKKIIYNTYLSAVNSGDKNVYFLDGENFFTKDIPFDECTVDGIHPNDTGMYLMAKGFMSVLEKLNL